MDKKTIEMLLQYLENEKDDIEKNGLIATLDEAIIRVEKKLKDLGYEQTEKLTTQTQD